jgi:lipopolysaccharide export system protein LptA
MIRKYNVYLILFLLPLFVVAQRQDTDTTIKEGTRLDFLFAERYNLFKLDSVNDFISLAGKVQVKQGNTLFYADSAILNRQLNTLEAFGNVHINDADSIHTYAQYLKYLGKERKAFLKTKVKLTDGKGELTTDALEYDVAVKIGIYLTGGKLINKKSVLTSQEGYYYGDTRDVIFKRKVLMVDPNNKIISDTLQYNTGTEIATFTSPTTINNLKEKRIIKTKSGYYDMKNKKAELYKRSFIEDSTYTFTADEMAFDDSSGLGEFRGNAVYRSKDSVQGFDMIANNIKTNNKKNSLLATQKPILLIKQGADSIFISADTLYTAKLSDFMKIRTVPNVRDSAITPTKMVHNKEDSSDKFFEAFYHVKIYSDSLQAVGDSLFYSLKDSVFRLFKSPIIWAQENQITGDTIYLYIKEKKPERVYVFENAMAINRVDSSDYFNQLKGRIINTLFTDGKVHLMHAKGNSSNIYYATDDNKKFIGVNKSTADVIDVYFKESKPDRVLFIRNLQGTTYPMRQINHDELRLRGFKWQIEKRPKSKFDILSD